MDAPERFRRRPVERQVSVEGVSDLAVELFRAREHQLPHVLVVACEIAAINRVAHVWTTYSDLNESRGARVCDDDVWAIPEPVVDLPEHGSRPVVSWLIDGFRNFETVRFEQVTERLP